MNWKHKQGCVPLGKRWVVCQILVQEPSGKKRVIVIHLDAIHLWKLTTKLQLVKEPKLIFLWTHSSVTSYISKPLGHRWLHGAIMIAPCKKNAGRNKIECTDGSSLAWCQKMTSAIIWLHHALEIAWCILNFFRRPAEDAPPLLKGVPPSFLNSNTTYFPTFALSSLSATVIAGMTSHFRLYTPWQNKQPHQHTSHFEG